MALIIGNVANLSRFVALHSGSKHNSRFLPILSLYILFIKTGLLPLWETVSMNLAQ